MFDGIVGNTHVKDYLSRLKGSNSLLFAGPDGIGKSLFAQALAIQLLGSIKHPDLHIYRPEGKIGMHSIASMRQLSEDVYMAPFQGPWKVFIIHDADRMLTYSANALLKTFEEPATDSIIILLSSHPASLLPTILSRCRTIHFHALKEEDIAALLQSKWKLGEENAKHIAGLAQGSMGNAIRLLEQGGEAMREMTLNILSHGKMSSWKHLNEAAQQITDKVEASKKQIEDSIRHELYDAPQENLTAVQKEAFQKEIEGVLAMRLMNEAQALFNVILGWYRDMVLMQVRGDRSLLMHRDYAPAIEQALQRGEIVPLETVQKAIADAKLSLDRSTSLTVCLETLFLRLNLL